MILIAGVGSLPSNNRFAMSCCHLILVINRTDSTLGIENMVVFTMLVALVDL